MIGEDIKAKGEEHVFVSVIIPTYNRADRVIGSVQSALDAFSGLVSHEIILVDDASTDSTLAVLNSAYAREIEAGYVRIVTNAVNLGVTGSRNEGYVIARGEWALFLDSDDQLLRDAADEVVRTLVFNREKPIVFFRCIDERNRFVGRRFDRDVTLELKTYLKHMSYGEALVVVNKRLVGKPPFIKELRGHEGLGLSRIIKEHGPALLSRVIARRYNRDGGDRLSVSGGFAERMPLIARGHVRMIREFYRDMDPQRTVAYFLKASVYWAAWSAYRILHLGDRK